MYADQQFSRVQHMLLSVQSQWECFVHYIYSENKNNIHLTFQDFIA